MLTFELEGEKQTRALAGRLARFMEPGAIILLDGPLGAGKTTFVRGLAKGLGLSDDYDIVSPTFTLLNIYPARIPLYHADCYRTSAEDMFELELVEQASDGVLAIEWPHENSLFNTADCWCVAMRYSGKNKRLVEVRAPLNMREKLQLAEAMA